MMMYMHTKHIDSRSARTGDKSLASLFCHGSSGLGTGAREVILAAALRRKLCCHTGRQNQQFRLSSREASPDVHVFDLLARSQCQEYNPHRDDTQGRGCPHECASRRSRQCTGSQFKE